VGITERFAESCRVFDAHFGTTIARNYKRENVRRPDGREHDELISLVRPFVRRDFVLYERAKDFALAIADRDASLNSTIAIDMPRMIFSSILMGISGLLKANR
jgi:hypothetical protein